MAVAEAEEELKMSDELMTFINEWKVKPGNLIMILHRVQEEFGYIPRSIAIELSRLIDVPLAKIYGVVTFYHFFKLTKPGKYKLQVCMGTACYLRGGGDLISELETMLGIGVNETTEDGIFSLEAVRCVGCCGLAPVVVCGTDVYGKLETDQLAEIVAKYRNAE
jgi:NADH-quinone oxidoreductase subunit E